MFINLKEKLPLVFPENPSSLNELIGYVGSMVFREICAEQRSAVEFFNFKYFSRGEF